MAAQSLPLAIHEQPKAKLVERTFRSAALGLIEVVATDVAVVAIYFAEHRNAGALETRRLGPSARHDVLGRAVRELEEYLAGTRESFALPLAPRGTAFQRAVWEALTAIPFGETRSYAEIAVAIGRPRAVRAVGGANARNPLSVVVPCHRVVGSRGDLTGYAGGIERKRWLLAHESTACRTLPSRRASATPGAAAGTRRP